MRNILFLLLVLTPSILPAQNSADKILGVWLTEIQDAKIEIYKKGAYYHGKVVWISEPNDENGKPVVDENNPNVKLQKRPVLKMDILYGFTFKNGEYINGFIYDPKEGKTYDCKLWLEGKTLKVRGYLGWLYDTKTWTRTAV